MRLLLAGGGTGGHLFPAVALAQRLLAEESKAAVQFVGTARGIEARVLPDLGLPLECIEVQGFVNRNLMGKLAMLPQLWRSVLQARRILDRFRPDVVVGVGGYASAPVLVAALWRKIPYVIHEQNAWPGLTNRLLGRWAKRVCLSLAEAERAFVSAPTLVTGNPLRPGMEECPPISDGPPTLLVFGGSLGARAINDGLLAALPHLAGLRDHLTIIHQTGAGDVERVRQGYVAAGWPADGVVPFIHDMAAVYGRAHLVVCRAGATTIAELTACGRPAILIPYPHAAGDHQSANARALARKGAVLLLPQGQLSGEHLARLIGDLLQDRRRLLSMAGAAGSLARRGAVDTILEICRDIAARRS
jgi:UDP-N-acetylglucosamine--N-acetylmuramyl-(pentapeptide) pyrophosphoryl-undecaprenol N-acetylglucosamine transferase